MLMTYDFLENDVIMTSSLRRYDVILTCWQKGVKNGGLLSGIAKLLQNMINLTYFCTKEFFKRQKHYIKPNF